MAGPWERYQPQPQAKPWERYQSGNQEPNTEDPEILPDVAKSAATGLGKGAVGVVAAPFDIGSAVGGYLAKKAVRDKTFGVTPDSVVGRGLEAWFGPNGLAEQLPNSLTRGIQNKVGLTYQPQTTAGKYAETIGETAPFIAALPSQAIKNAPNLAGKAARVLKDAALAGGGSELAGQMTEGTEYEPYARLAGGLLGYGAGNYVAGGAANIGRGLVARNPDKLEAAAETMISNAGKPFKEPGLLLRDPVLALCANRFPAC